MEGLRQTTGVASEGTGRGGPEPAPTPLLWSGRRDLNPRPQRPERCALPSCATSRAVRQSSGSPRPTVPTGRGWSSSNVASGRQKNRNGAYLLVPRPGETFTIALPMRISPLTSRDGERAVRHQGADARQAHLTAVGVSGDQQVVAEGGGLRGGVGRVHDREPEQVRRSSEARPAGRARRCAHRPGRGARSGNPLRSTSRRTFVRSSQPSAVSCATRSADAPAYRSTRPSSSAEVREVVERLRGVSSRSSRARTTTPGALGSRRTAATVVSTASGSARKSPVTTVTSAAGRSARNAAFPESFRTKCRSERWSTVRGACGGRR